MKTENFSNTSNWLGFSTIIKSVMLLAVMMNFSCEQQEEIVPNKLALPQTYNFIKSDFIGSIQCYDASGNQIEYLSPSFTKNDFLFSDNWIYPYETIVLKKDSSVWLNYTLKEITNTDNGMITTFNDTLYFYYSTGSSRSLLFSGLLGDQKLLIPAYGYKLEYPPEIRTGTNGVTNFGYPDLPSLLKKTKAENFIRLYIQRFDFIYEKVHEQ